MGSGKLASVALSGSAPGEISQLSPDFYLAFLARFVVSPWFSFVSCLSKDGKVGVTKLAIRATRLMLYGLRDIVHDVRGLGIT